MAKTYHNLPVDRRALRHGLQLFTRATRYDEGVGLLTPSAIHLQTEEAGEAVRWSILHAPVTPEQVAFSALARGAKRYSPRFATARRVGHYLTHWTDTALQEITAYRQPEASTSEVTVLTLRNAQASIWGGAFEREATREFSDGRVERLGVAESDALVTEFLRLTNEFVQPLPASTNVTAQRA